MVSRVSLQNIVNADWSKQYLDSNGEVKDRVYRYDFFGLGPKLIKLLRHVPLIGALFPKPDILQASAAIKKEIVRLFVMSTNEKEDGPVILQAAKKVNTLITKIINAQTAPNLSVWNPAFIDLKELLKDAGGIDDDEKELSGSEGSDEEEELSGSVESDGDAVPPTTPAKVTDKVAEIIPATPENVEGDKSALPTTPSNVDDAQQEEGTPAPGTPTADVRVEILPDDAEATPVAPQEPQAAPKATDTVIVVDNVHEDEFVLPGDESAFDAFFDKEDAATTPPLPQPVAFEVVELEAATPAAPAEEVKVPTKEVIAQDLADAEKTVAKATEKASTRIAGEKHQKEQPGTKNKKVVVEVNQGQVKPAPAPKKGRGKK